ncbi:MAG: D-hexose-6-phosphate mutarotase [Candidatus Acidiferrales bacterium]
MKSGGAAGELNQRFEIPGVARIVEGNGGLLKVRITSPEAEGEIYLHGANITSWKPSGGEEALFVSAKSRWEDGVAIRGGVPICFPWFGGKAGDAKAPAHGFVRTKAWRLDSVERTGGGAAVTLSTGSDESTKKWWVADFRLEHRVTFGTELHMELGLKNSGKAPLRFEEALHTYFRVGNIEKARLHGLSGMRYTDKTDSRKAKLQQGDVEITSETDREYLDTPHEVELEDPVLRRRIRIANENSRTTVVWNPWVEKAKAMSDFGDEEWKQMMCVETTNVSQFAVEVAAGEEHRMKARIRIVGL